MTKRQAPGDIVPVMRPMLPDAERLLPYLRRIDAARLYSNFGPLTIEFQNRLVELFGVRADGIVAASSGTAALMAAILATAGPATPKRPFALVPAFTFAATAVAAERCGYRGYLVDVDPHSWMLDPERLVSHPALHQVRVVVVVAPFGRPVVQSPWLAFQKRTGVPVVIDAAASFDCVCDTPTQYFQELPTVLSFHATKSFATGEGGCIVSTDAALVDRAAQALNFGFHMSRDSASASLNGKMSEYHAAVGLAELDGWAMKQEMLRRVAACYREHLSRIIIRPRFFAWPDISGCYALHFCLGGDEVDRVQKELRRAGVDFRFWYGMGLHSQTHFSNSPRDTVDVTESLGQRLIGLPTALDMPEEVVARVVTAIHAGLGGQ